jgi:hypothetical protein
MGESPLEHFNEEAARVLDTLRGAEPSQLYVSLANLASLTTSFIRSKGAPGWSAALVDEAGSPMLGTKEQKQIEDIVAAAPWLRDLLLKEEAPPQVGGVVAPAGLKPGGLFQNMTPSAPLTGNDVSLDNMFQLLLKKTADMDEYWKKSTEGSEYMKKIYDTDIPVGPLPPGAVAGGPTDIRPVFKSKTFAVLLVAVIDSIRVSLAMSPYNTDFNRQALTLLIFIEELVTGQWRQMILTGLGFISPSGVAAGVFFKYMVNAWMLLNPGLRTQIATDLFRSGKSLLIGGVLWAAATLPPAMVQKQTAEQLAKLKEFINKNRANIETVLAGSEKILKRKIRTDINSLAVVSLDDIQGLQELARIQPLVCSKEFREIVKEGDADPFIRLLFELLGVPVVDKDVMEVCGASQPVPLGELIAGSMGAAAGMPAISQAPTKRFGLQGAPQTIGSMVGGVRRTRSRHRKSRTRCGGSVVNKS